MWEESPSSAQEKRTSIMRKEGGDHKEEVHQGGETTGEDGERCSSVLFLLKRKRERSEDKGVFGGRKERTSGSRILPWQGRKNSLLSVSKRRGRRRETVQIWRRRKRKEEVRHTRSLFTRGETVLLSLERRGGRELVA